jgi:hypothetical protein
VGIRSGFGRESEGECTGKLTSVTW